MEFVYFTDIHYYKNPQKSYVMSDGMNSWLHNQLNVTDIVFDYAKENNVSTVIHGGDLFEEKSRIPQDLYNIVWEYYEKKSKDFEIIFNTGNHDLLTLGRTSSLKPFSKIVEIITKPTEFCYKDLLLKIIPYGMIENNLKIPYPESTDTTVLIIHEDISDLQYGDKDYMSSTPLKQQIFLNWDYVLNGHIHKSQNVNNIINVGSPMIQDWGEIDKKRFIHYTPNIIKSVPIKGITFEEVPGISNRIKKVIQKDNTNFYRISCTAEEVNDPIFKKFNVTPNIMKVKKKEIRLKNTLSLEEEFRKYIEITNTELDKDTLFKIGVQLTQND